MEQGKRRADDLGNRDRHALERERRRYRPWRRPSIGEQKRGPSYSQIHRDQNQDGAQAEYSTPKTTIGPCTLRHVGQQNEHEREDVGV
ncbi:MAG: hypothetical protein ACK559_08025 [bacterium]